MCDNILIPLGSKKTDAFLLKTPRPSAKVGTYPRSSLDLVGEVKSPKILTTPSPLTSNTALSKEIKTKLPISSSLNTNSLPPLPAYSTIPAEKVEDVLMQTSSYTPKPIASFNAEQEIGNTLVSSLSTQPTKLIDSPSTAVFETYRGIVQDKDVEQSLVDSGFIPTEKLLTQDKEGRISCHFIKTRDKLGHASFVEIDTDYTNGMGFVKVSPNEEVMTVSTEASIIPYSMKIGTFEANNDLYGVGFECDNGVCMMQRKNPSLAPTETVFSYSNDGEVRSGIIKDHPVPYPIVKMTDILANPKEVQETIIKSHRRMRNVAFDRCKKDVELLKKRIKELEEQVILFDKNSEEVSDVLSCGINKLLYYHKGWENVKTLCDADKEKIKSLQFNLHKRHDLLNDHISLCKSVKERSDRISTFTQELTDINEYTVNLFQNLSSEFTE